MSEFKFACPVCGQHITADSSTSGSELGCPTCFRKIKVPQAPTSADPKFILAAAEVSRPRPTPTVVSASPSAPETPSGRSAVPVILVTALVLSCAAGTTLFLLRGKIFNRNHEPVEPEMDSPADQEATTSTGTPVPPAAGKVTWTLDLANAPYPEGSASGKIHGFDFLCGRAILDGGTLTLRHGRGSTTELGMNLYLPVKQAGELAGKTVTVTADSAVVPWVTLRWKEGTTARSETIKGNYALKVEFGPLGAGRLPGKIYICLNDETRSCVAGSFNAQIKKPSPPKPATPRAANAN